MAGDVARVADPTAAPFDHIRPAAEGCPTGAIKVRRGRPAAVKPLAVLSATSCSASSCRVSLRNELAWADRFGIGMGGSPSGTSVMRHSVVRAMAATDAVFCRAERVTLAGSMMLAFSRSSNSPVTALRPTEPVSRSTWLHDDHALQAGVDGDPAQAAPRAPRRTMLAPGAPRRPSRLDGQLLDRLAGPDEGGAAAGDDALLDGGAGRREGVLDAVLLLLQLDLGGGADLEDGDAAGQVGQPLLQLLLVPVGVGVLDLALDLRDTVVDVGLRRRHRRRWWWSPW